MIIMKTGGKRNNCGSRNTKSGKNQNARREGKLQLLTNIGSGYHQTSGDKRKNKERLH